MTHVAIVDWPLSVEEAEMKRLALAFGIMVMVIVPAMALAGYDYPSGGGGNGGPGMGEYPSGGGASEPSTGGSAPSMAAGDEVTIVDFAFEPASLLISAGTTVRWHNAGDAPHTVTAFTGAFDSGTIGSGGDYSYTFADPGAYLYHCTIHPNMVGTVRVSAS
jgi:plastocyanin